ncbi:hypothetical protein DESC_460143 [Desulfosarcina cetonica]|nr:hypothetical protein DESC_460143 [Desulfosarcina cetonica]
MRIFSCASPASRQRPCARRKSGKAVADENLDRILEYHAQGHADVLPEAAQCQLGNHFPAGVDGHVLHQNRQRTGKHSHPAARRGGRLDPVRHHLHAGGHRDVREKEPFIRTVADGAHTA